MKRYYNSPEVEFSVFPEEDILEGSDAFGDSDDLCGDDEEESE